MNLFEKIFRALNEAGVKYLVVGGVAVNLYGYARFTGDLDILILLNEDNVSRLDKLMKDLGYLERLPVSVRTLGNHAQVQKWLEEKNLLAFSFIPPKDNPLQIDVIIEYSLQFAKFSKKRKIRTVSGVKIPLVDIDDLIEMKKRAARPKDMIDLEALINLKGL